MPPTPHQSPTPVLATGRLRLDPLRIDDAEEMTATLDDPALYRFIGGGPPTSLELRDLYARWIAGPPRPSDAWHNWAVRLTDDTLIGHVQATAQERGRRADIAWILGTPWQGHGYAAEAAIALVGWLERAGVQTITAHVHPQHAASARVAERAGLVATDVVEGGEVVWQRVTGGEPSRET